MGFAKGLWEAFTANGQRIWGILLSGTTTSRDWTAHPGAVWFAKVKANEWADHIKGIPWWTAS